MSPRGIGRVATPAAGDARVPGGRRADVATHGSPAGSPMDSLLPTSAFSPGAVFAGLAVPLAIGDARVRDAVARHWPMLLRFLGCEAELL